MSCVDDSIVFKSYITRCTPTKARHLPTEYIGKLNIWVKAEPKKKYLMMKMICKFVLKFNEYFR